ncbi:protein FAR1-RELATED SEQUENCE 2-like [Helianthus annuus]|uniref:protein FAR1-RELATED SEQUENCE 2-like n=1 Tax=Helianthus annuus TaxID=4232 RepID=UPI0016531A25|nr:protein FAR1-RELATED SEQUENCE 2-like [Helianthus annuus]
MSSSDSADHMMRFTERIAFYAFYAFINFKDNISKWEERLCTKSGRKFFKPKVSGSITPAVGMFFKSFDEAFAFYKRYALAVGFSARKNTSWKNVGGLVTISIQYYENMYGGFGEVGASKVDCKNYRRDLNLYIGEYDAEMVVRRLIRKEECCPGFTCDYVIGEDRRLKGLFWADEQSKKIIQCLVTYLVLMLLINQTSMIWFLYYLLVGPVLSANTDFNTRMTHVVWNDTIIPEDFETEWHSIMSTFGLENHEWLKDMYDLRFDWIPAYYQGEDLAGLMRTTSRCESENYFFGQICNPRCTLVEFFTHFETAMDIQRHEHRRNDHDTRYIQCKPWSDFVQYNKQEDGLSISCSCKRFEQFGILCRHTFYVLRYEDISEFPRRYVHRRWMRDVVSVGSNHSNIRFDEIGRNSAIDKVYREIVVANEYVINRLVGDLDELCRYRDHIKSYIDKADEVMVAAPPPSRKERFADIGGNLEKSDSMIRVPIKIKTKGCGVQKRIKSNREIAIQKSSKIQKSCRVCGGKGHNSRTCKDKVSSNAIGSSNGM